MAILLLILLFSVLIFLPQWWANRVLLQYGYRREDFPGTGGELARVLLDYLDLGAVAVEETEAGDHYDPEAKAVRLSAGNFGDKSLTAIVVAAHEVGHAVQDKLHYAPFDKRIGLIKMTQSSERLGAGLMMLAPLLMLLHVPAAGLLVAIGGFVSLFASVLVHLITLPVEWDASFNRALPLLKAGNYIDAKDQRAARRILLACALTYVAASLASLLNLARWLVILRR